MQDTLIDTIDRILEPSSCRLSIDEIADFIFGGFLGQPDLKPFLVEVVLAGMELKKSEGLPLRVPLPADIGFFLVAWGVDWLTQDRIRKGEKGIGRVLRRMEKIERRHGAVDGLPPWEGGAGPAAWEEANTEFDRIADEITAEALEQCEATDMAALFATDGEQYARRWERGRRGLAELTGRDYALAETPGPREAHAESGAV